MAIGSAQQFAIAIASGASTSAEIDLGRGYSKVIYDPTGVGGSSMFFAAGVASAVGGTYRQVKYPIASGMSAPQTCTVGSAASGSWVDVSAALAGIRFVKIAADATITNGATVELICSDV